MPSLLAFFFLLPRFSFFSLTMHDAYFISPLQSISSGFIPIWWSYSSLSLNLLNYFLKLFYSNSVSEFWFRSFCSYESVLTWFLIFIPLQLNMYPLFLLCYPLCMLLLTYKDSPQMQTKPLYLFRNLTDLLRSKIMLCHHLIFLHGYSVYNSCSRALNFCWQLFTTTKLLSSVSVVGCNVQHHDSVTYCHCSLAQYLTLA